VHFVGAHDQAERRMLSSNHASYISTHLTSLINRLFPNILETHEVALPRKLSKNHYGIHEKDRTRWNPQWVASSIVCNNVKIL